MPIFWLYPIYIFLQVTYCISDICIYIFQLAKQPKLDTLTRKQGCQVCKIKLAQNSPLEVFSLEIVLERTL